jgi:hypothetical protein
MEKLFNPLMTPRVGFPEERQKKKGKPPSTTEAEFVRALRLAGIYFARISADQALQADARARSLKMVRL